MRKLSATVWMVAVVLAPGLRAEESDLVTVPAGAATVVSSFESADRDADGKLDMEEVRNRMTKAFFELDENGDGVLQKEEYSSVFVDEHPELADSDRDDTLTQREFVDHTAVLFASVDSDEDGYLTREELAAAGHEEDD